MFDINLSSSSTFLERQSQVNRAKRRFALALHPDKYTQKMRDFAGESPQLPYLLSVSPSVNERIHQIEKWAIKAIQLNPNPTEYLQDQDQIKHYSQMRIRGQKRKIQNKGCYYRIAIRHLRDIRGFADERFGVERMESPEADPYQKKKASRSTYSSQFSKELSKKVEEQLEASRKARQRCEKNEEKRRERRKKEREEEERRKKEREEADRMLEEHLKRSEDLQKRSEDQQKRFEDQRKQLLEDQQKQSEVHRKEKDELMAMMKMFMGGFQPVPPLISQPQAEVKAETKPVTGFGLFLSTPGNTEGVSTVSSTTASRSAPTTSSFGSTGSHTPEPPPSTGASESESHTSAERLNLG